MGFKTKILYGFLVVSIGLLFGFLNITSAQTEQEFMITWKADNYVPADYQGKILPTRNTVIEVKLELIDANKLADLSKKEIRWFVNDQLQKRKIGDKTFIFQTPPAISDDLPIQISILDFKGATLYKTFSIPLAEPVVIIDAPIPDKRIPAGIYNFRALPYFFNIPDLTFTEFVWSVNNQKTSGPTERPDSLILNASDGLPGDEINLAIDIKNLLNPLEFARQTINFLIK